MSARREYRVWEPHEEQVGAGGAFELLRPGAAAAGPAAGAPAPRRGCCWRPARGIAPAAARRHAPPPTPARARPPRQALRDGVKKHGLGAWEKIRSDPDFEVLRCARRAAPRAPTPRAATVADRARAPPRGSRRRDRGGCMQPHGAPAPCVRRAPRPERLRPCARSLAAAAPRRGRDPSSRPACPPTARALACSLRTSGATW
jgi:hypothetical protein